MAVLRAHLACSNGPGITAAAQWEAPPRRRWGPSHGKPGGQPQCRMTIDLDGDREVLGVWFQDTEGAKFWMQVLSELKQRA